MTDIFFDNKIAGIIIKFLQNEISEPEMQELQAWIDSSTRAKEIFEELTNEEKLPEEVAQFTDSRERIMAKIQEAVPEMRKGIVLKQSSFRRNWVAAAVVVIISLTGYIFLRPILEDHNSVATGNEPRYKNDILPGSNNAKLKLEDGTIISLDSVNRGEIAKQGNISINGAAGELKYVAGKSAGGEGAKYNLVSTQKKGQYELTLSEGTHVWLNSESSIYFPAQFFGDKRTVEITGEVFFDVATNVKMPFIVRYKNMNIEVTGTEFNISAYENEKSVNTTLVKGSVTVTSGNNLLKLVPGQQAQLTKEILKLNKSVDVEEAIAWKEGHFAFNNADIKTIMRQLERWYGIEVVYESERNLRFNVTSVPRDLPISELLKLFELSEEIRFRIDGNKVVVIK